MNSKTKPNKVETDRRKDFSNNFFLCFFNNKNNKHYSKSTPLGAAFAERFNGTIRDLLKRPVFLKKQMAIGLVFYPQKRNNITKEYNLLLNDLQ